MALLDPDTPAHARTLERLGSEIAIWLTTVSAEGQPQSTPIWFHWDGDSFLFWSQAGTPKLANIAANPRVSLHLVGDPEAEEDVVTFEGVAAPDPSAPSADAIETYLAKYRALIDRFGWTTAGYAADYHVAVRVRPTRVRVF